MPDTKRTWSALAALLADNNTGDISAQDLRDFLATVRPHESANSPTTSDDSANTSGNGIFTEGSAWIDGDNTIWECADPSPENAVWVPRGYADYDNVTVDITPNANHRILVEAGGSWRVYTPYELARAQFLQEAITLSGTDKDIFVSGELFKSIDITADTTVDFLNIPSAGRHWEMYWTGTQDGVGHHVVTHTPTIEWQSGEPPDYANMDPNQVWEEWFWGDEGAAGVIYGDHNFGARINYQTGTVYQLQPTDDDKTVRATNASAISLRIAAEDTMGLIPNGYRARIRQWGAGTVTVVPMSGVNLNSLNGLRDLAGQYAQAEVEYQGSNTWALHGDLGGSAPTSASLEDMIVMHDGIMRDPSTIPTVISTGGATYDSLYALVPDLFDDHSASGYSYGPIADHPQWANITTTVDAAIDGSTTADLQAAIDAAASNAIIGIEGTFNGANGDTITPKSGQTLVGAGSTNGTPGVLDNIAINANAIAVYNLTVQNTVQSGTVDGTWVAIRTSANSILNHCTADNGDGIGWKVGQNVIVEYCLSSGNGRYGMNHNGQEGGATGSIIRYNKLFQNNSTSADRTVENYSGTDDASAMKFPAGSEGCALRHNWFDDNRGNGVWLDGQSDECVVEWNLTENNDEAGVFIELQEAVTTVTEARYNSCRDNRWGLNYADADCYGHHNFVSGNLVALYLKSSNRPSYTLSDVREHNSVFYHDPVTKSGVEGWVVNLREENGGSKGLPAALNMDGIEYHLTTGTSGDDWYYRRFDGVSAEQFTAAEWDAFGYETNADRNYDQ